MNITKPFYYDLFHCIADRCPDSCCQEWEVQVDPDAAACYQQLPGALGDCLRAVLQEEDGVFLMSLADGRCPMWREDGLCRIQAELGEVALCKTCREFPRLTHDYGTLLEHSLALSCPEAARLILQASSADRLTMEAGEGEMDEDLCLLLSSRENAQALLQSRDRPIGETLALLLLYGCEAQAVLDGEEALPFDASSALETAHSLARQTDAQPLLDFFLELDMLTDRWETLLRHPHGTNWEDRHLALARYLADRYWLQAVSDFDLYSRVKLIVISTLLVKILGGNPVQTAQLFSKEIENSAQNVDALLEAAYSHPAFTDDKLLYLLLKV